GGEDAGGATEEDAGGDGAGAGSHADATGSAAGAGTGGGDAGNKGICASRAGERDSGLTGDRLLGCSGFQRVDEPQRLQKRRTPSPVAQMSASMPVSSIFSRALQELQTSERRPRSISTGDKEGKSTSQNFRLGSTKATPSAWTAC